MNTLTQIQAAIVDWLRENPANRVIFDLDKHGFVRQKRLSGKGERPRCRLMARTINELRVKRFIAVDVETNECVVYCAACRECGGPCDDNADFCSDYCREMNGTIECPVD